MRGRVDNCPILVGSGLVEEVDVGFLNEDKVSFLGVDLVEEIQLGGEGLVEILLPKADDGRVVGVVHHEVNMESALS